MKWSRNLDQAIDTQDRILSQMAGYGIAREMPKVSILIANSLKFIWGSHVSECHSERAWIKIVSSGYVSRKIFLNSDIYSNLRFKKSECTGSSKLLITRYIASSVTSDENCARDLDERIFPYPSKVGNLSISRIITER